MKALIKTNTQSSLKRLVVVIVFQLALGQGLFAATTDKDFILDNSAPDGAGILFKSSAHPSSRFWEIDNTSGKFRIFETGGAGEVFNILSDGTFVINLIDNIGDALDIQQGTDNYININTTNGTEAITFGNALTNLNYDFLGQVDSGKIQTGGAMELGILATGDRNPYIDFHADGTTVDYGLRVIRNSGENGTSDISSKGTGGINIITEGSAPIVLKTNNTERMTIGAAGDFTITGNLIPAADDTYSLGSLTNAWSDLYVNATTIYLGGVALTNNGGQLEWAGTGIETTSTSSGPLFVENTGTGNSLRVNDEASDGTPFVIDAAGNVGIGTTTPGHKLVISDPNITASRAGLSVTQTGAITGTGYGINVSKTGASTTNVGGYFSATGATNNYGLIVGNGNVGIGTTTPAAAFTVEASSGTEMLRIGNSTNNIFLINSDGLASIDRDTDDTADSDVQLHLTSSNSDATLELSTFGQTHWYIGADRSDAGSLKFYTSGSTKDFDNAVVTITTAGKVGIGLTDPDAKLDVRQGSTTLTQPAGNWAAQIENSVDGIDQHGLSVSGRYGAANIKIFEVAKHWGTGGEGYYPIFYVDGAANMYWKGGNAAQDTLMYWEAGTGNVGIGTATPDTKLLIKGPATTWAAAKQLAISTVDSSNSLVLQLGYAWSAGVRSGGRIQALDDSTGCALLLNPDGGNVGIGTTGPAFPLEINDTAGGKMRLTFNDPDGGATDFADISVGANGKLTIGTADSDGAVGHIELNPDGGVGILTAPAAGVKLDVNGSVRLRSHTNGYVKTDSNGDLSTRKILAGTFTTGDIGVAHTCVYGGDITGATKTLSGGRDRIAVTFTGFGHIDYSVLVTLEGTEGTRLADNDVEPIVINRANGSFTVILEEQAVGNQNLTIHVIIMSRS